MRPIHRIKVLQERYAMPEETGLMARAKLKQAVIKILTKIQAFHFYETIKRNKHCVIPLKSFIKGPTNMPTLGSADIKFSS